MINFILANPLILHGLTNLGGVAAFLFGASAGFPDGPWLFSTRVHRHSMIGRLWGVIWFASTLALITAGIGLIQGTTWWREAALAGCGLSLLSILPWWRSVVPGANVGAIFDILGIIFLLTPWVDQLL